MKQINFSPTMIKKSVLRFRDSPITRRYKLNTNYNSTNLKILGLFKSNVHLILEDQNSGITYIEPISTNRSIMPKEEDIKINLVKVGDIKYDPSIFIPMKTGDSIDYMFSTEGGIYPATNYLLVGDPGIGKSTQGLDMLAKIKKTDPTRKILFISGEMNQIDMYGYVQRYPAFGQIPTLFLCDYIDIDTKSVLEKTIEQGWDLILIDSFIEVQEAVQASNRLTRNHAEKWLIDLMVKSNKGENKEKKYTSFLAIQQVTKGGNFVGSNKLKHNTTGMIELRFSSEFSGDRYAKVTKNRRGYKYEKIFFSLDNPLEVEYDQKRLDRDNEIRKRLQKEKEILLTEEEKFNQIFGIDTEDILDAENQ